MSVMARTFAAVFLLVLVSCAANDGNVRALPPDPAFTSAATLLVSRLDTGFLYFGNTRIRIVSVDGRGSIGDYDRPLRLAPGTHTVLVTAYRDPVAAYACITSTFEAGKIYVARSTKPYMETTTMWIEDNATGEIVGPKFAAQMIRQPMAFTPAFNQLLFGSVPGTC